MHLSKPIIKNFLFAFFAALLLILVFCNFFLQTQLLLTQEQFFSFTTLLHRLCIQILFIFSACTAHLSFLYTQASLKLKRENQRLETMNLQFTTAARSSGELVFEYIPSTGTITLPQTAEDILSSDAGRLGSSLWHTTEWLSGFDCSGEEVQSYIICRQDDKGYCCWLEICGFLIKNSDTIKIVGTIRTCAAPQESFCYAIS